MRTGGFRCGSRTFVWTSHVSDWIVGRGTDSGSKKSHVPVPQKWALWFKTIPIFLVEPFRENGDSLIQRTHFWDIGKWEFFDPKPSFPGFGNFDLSGGRTLLHPQYSSWEFHDQLWEALFGTISEKKGRPQPYCEGNSGKRFLRVVLPRGRSRNCLQVRMRERGWGVMWGCGEDSAVQPHIMGGVRGAEEGHTREHTQERTRECCTYPLATYPLKSGGEFQ